VTCSFGPGGAVFGCSGVCWANADGAKNARIERKIQRRILMDRDNNPAY